ncbi:MAG: hypothetical protein BWY83_02932 [bacterium ADurb.Bin478]|nr:MAG: hypothetical protein BWY83_02932 [bacterium ADurb.Bin478]
MLHHQNVLDHLAVAGIAKIGNPVEHPKGRVPAEFGKRAGTHGKRIRCMLNTAVHGHVHRRIGVIDAEPEHAAHRIRQPAARLSDKGEPGLLRGDRPFVKIGGAVHFPGQRPPAIGQAIGPGADVLGHVQRSALKVIPHQSHGVLDRQFFIRFDPQRQPFSPGHALDKIFIPVHRRCGAAEHRPDPRFAEPHGVKGERRIGVAKTEIRILAGIIVLLPGERDHIRRIEAIEFVVQRESPDARLVGMAADGAIRNTLRHPYGALAARTFADHLHDPNLLWIGDGKGLAAAAIAVLCHQIGHHFDGLSRGLGALQSQ